MTDFSQHDSHKEVIDRHAEYMTEGNSQYLPGPAGADAPEVNTAIDPHGLPKTDHDRYDLYQKEAVAAGHQNQQASGQSGWRRRSLKFWIILVLVVIAVIVGVVVGAVVGTQNAEGEPQEAVTSPPPIPTPTVPAPPVPTPTEPSSPNSTSGDFDLDPDEDEGGDAPPIETPSAADISMGIVFNSTFTFYGTDDGNDSENCSTPDTSCGFFASVSTHPHGSYCRDIANIQSLVMPLPFQRTSSAPAHSMAKASPAAPAGASTPSWTALGTR